jgi:hypothetical protein
MLVEPCETAENCGANIPTLLAKIPDEFKPLAALGIGAFVVVFLALFHGVGLHWSINGGSVCESNPPINDTQRTQQSTVGNLSPCKPLHDKQLISEISLGRAGPRLEGPVRCPKTHWQLRRQFITR